MGNFLSGLYAAMIVGIISSILPPPATAQSPLRDSSADIVELVMPSVVGIAIKGMIDPSEDDGSRKGFNAPVIVDLVGSGVIADATGLIVTNRHVIEGAYQIQVRLHDGTTAK